MEKTKEAMTEEEKKRKAEEKDVEERTDAERAEVRLEQEARRQRERMIDPITNTEGGDPYRDVRDRDMDGQYDALENEDKEKEKSDGWLDLGLSSGMELDL